MKKYYQFTNSGNFVDALQFCTVSTENELVSINDEIFVSKAGQPWRVCVAHQFGFRDGLITSLDVHLDLGAAHEALSGRTVLESALLPVTASQKSAAISNEKIEEVVASFLRESGDNSTLLADDVAAYIPGDTRRLRFARS